MKIIGTASGVDFIVIATQSELARIAGSSGPRSHYNESGPEIKVGCQIDVSSMYGRLISLRAAEGELAKAQKTLRAVADLIDPIRPTIVEAQQEPQT